MKTLLRTTVSGLVLAAATGFGGAVALAGESSVVADPAAVGGPGGRRAAAPHKVPHATQEEGARRGDRRPKRK